jgi:hypothetical protein
LFCFFVTFSRTSRHPSLRRWHGNVNSLRRARRNRWRWTPGACSGPRTQPQVAWHTIFKDSWQIDGRTGTSASASATPDTIPGSAGTTGSAHWIVERNCRCWSWQWIRSCRMWQSWTSIRRWAIRKQTTITANFLWSFFFFFFNYNSESAYAVH